MNKLTVDRYAVMGNPIHHSLSPRIHRLFAQQTQQALSYEAIQVPIDGLAAALDEFAHSGGKGLNITVPFKEEAWRRVGQRSPRAERAGAVNTIAFRNGRRYGDNTDGAGLVRDLTINHRIDCRNRDILILGAGGAVKGVLAPLLELAPRRLVVANRSVDKARALVDSAGAQERLIACGLTDMPTSRFDLIINGTAASLQGAALPLPATAIDTDTVCYDMMYGSAAQGFLNACAHQGARLTLDGLGMLVEQAAEAFFLWREVRPQTAAIIAALRADLP